MEREKGTARSSPIFGVESIGLAGMLEGGGAIKEDSKCQAWAAVQTAQVCRRRRDLGTGKGIKTEVLDLRRLRCPQTSKKRRQAGINLPVRGSEEQAGLAHKSGAFLKPWAWGRPVQHGVGSEARRLCTDVGPTSFTCP